MAEERAQRRLAAILAADVVGYSRLMEADEAGTMAALKSRRRDVLEPLVAKLQGRVFKTTGDGVLVEFGSAVNAVQCAIDLQTAFSAANNDLPTERHIVLRIGINLGDVMVEGGDLYGDGVNIAARLEALSEPGGILLSGTAYDHMKSKVKVGFDDLGVQTLKNIAEPVRAYRVIGMPRVALAAAKATTDKPSIAVLPFTNMSGDPEQEYFADGVAEDIITALAKFHSFLVIARNSSFTYRGRAIDVKAVARDLGARYVVEGSVRKAGRRVRVTAQLIDVESSSHVWAERYDRELEDIFLVQDEITQSVAGAIGPEFESAEIKRASRPGRQNLTVWDLVMQARWHLGQYSKAGSTKAQELLLQAVNLDDRNAQAHALLAMTHWTQAIYCWSESVSQSRERALEAAQRAVSLDDSDANTQATLGMVLTLHEQNDQAVDVLSHAVRLNPNLAAAHGWLGIAYTYACDFEQATRAAKEAMRLSPRDLDRPFWMGAFSFAALAAHRYDEAIEITTTMLRDKPDLPTALRHRASALAWLGRTDEAHQVIDRLLKVAPETSIHQLRAVFTLGIPAVEEHWLEGLRKAGLPE